MTWISVLLVGLGVADLVRAGPAPRWSGHAAGLATVVAVALLTQLTSTADVLALALCSLTVTGWIELSRRTQTTGRAAWAPLTVVLGALALLVGFSGFASRPDGALGAWLRWADLPGAAAGVAPGRVLLLAGLMLLNLATANVLVRLVLLAVGAMRPDAVRASAGPQAADRLKGGRLLGPLERLVILGLGLAGEYGAASVVIAAKGLLRFPEIQAAGRQPGDPRSPGAAGAIGAIGAASPPGRRPGGPVGIDDVTEYFLVGSFVSWLIALVSLAVAR
ncbi:MAG TPA: hypothetical protein VFJ94_15070 [Intrasporangium sp.]|uniref:hypothetical protein n=1 Tax=Intrasporangium sp. TaxID=1925024 RepID=UPI002D777FE0|nr:hypothetical protein [Intrasporangium sp.]HET7399837.1 hypothetical protein [Intrasporangium sp.]